MRFTKDNLRMRAAFMAACASLAVVPGVASAQQAERRVSYTIAAQDLGTALTDLARQSGKEIYFRSDLTRGMRARALNGTMTVEEGLSRLLQGTGLTYRKTSAGSIVVEAMQASVAAPAPTASEAEPVIGREIIVTANKREQRLNDVGLTVQVLSGETLRERQVTSLQDIANSVPGLTYANTATNTPVFTLRGVGFNEASIGAIAAVTVYQDQAPLAFSVLASHSAYDLERIEVLKGPQGTLFGQNSTGGAINYVTAKPTNSMAAGMQVSYGRFNEVNAEGYVSGPLTDKLKARLAMRTEQGDAWQVSRSRPDGPDGRNGKTRNVMGRLLLDFEPSETVRIQANVNGWIDDSDPLAAQFIGLHITRPPGFGFITDYADAYPVTDNPRDADWDVDSISGRTRMAHGSLRADIELGGDVTLTSLTSAATYKTHKVVDYDGTPFSAGQYDQVGHIKTINQELRLSNGGASDVRWIVGGNAERSKTDQSGDGDFSASSNTLFLGAVLGYPISQSTFSNTQKITNLAVFGNVEYDVVPTVTLKGGLRYTDSKNKGRTCNADFSGEPNNTGGFFYDIVLGGAYGTYPVGTCFLANDLGETINGVEPGAPGEYADTLHEDNLSWRAGIDWKPSRDLLFYANAAKGYKAGSFATASGSSFRNMLPVRQESLMAYEGGFKATLLDRILQLNGAAFYYDYKDKQVRGKFIAPPFGTLDAVLNIPEASIRGGELELSFRPVEGLTIDSAVTYVDGKIDSYTGINGANVAGDFAGTRLPFTPKWQFSINPTFNVPVSDATSLYVGGSVNYKSDTTTVIGGDENPVNADPADLIQNRLPSYTLVDVRAGMTFNDGRLRIGAYGKNIFNEYYVLNVRNASDTAARYLGKAKTYGVQLSYTY
ncbi:TonB-dependent receptor domain-containing protein [Croceicoccus sediminis]|uniref:TonB-dependent receptor domain-containing protein n=1 Tax=Croceicoccus sediminis TaxID=2571150 RepID=UPI0014788126|nr:TonB-dependent receptor [Croceicoccus sediminis]